MRPNKNVASLPPTPASSKHSERRWAAAVDGEGTRIFDEVAYHSDSYRTGSDRILSSFFFFFALVHVRTAPTSYDYDAQKRIHLALPTLPSSVAAQPVTTIEDRVYPVGLVPILDCPHHYTCDTRLSILRCCYVLGESHIALGPDWVSVSGAIHCNDGSRLWYGGSVICRGWAPFR